MSRLPALVLLLGPALAACAGARTPAAPWPAAAPLHCAARPEGDAIAPIAERVSRSADTLWIRGGDGSMLPLVSHTGDPDRTIVYRYCGHLPQLDAHLVNVGFYEGSAYVLVDGESTNQTHVLGPPVVSPGGTRFGAVSLDLEAGYDANGVQVWRVTEHGPRFEWGLDGGDAWGASDPLWLGDGVLQFTMHRRGEHPGGHHRQRMVLEIGPTGLHLRPAR